VAHPMTLRRFRKFLLCIAATLSIAFVVVAWFIGGALVAPANRAVGLPPADLLCETVTLTTESGLTLVGWHVRSPNSSATVILLHPIRGDRRSMVSRAEVLRASGYSTLLIDLPAHGESQGDCITGGWRESQGAAAAVNFVRSTSPSHRIAIVGRSLGGAAALFASPLHIDALVLESVYPTITEAVHNRVAMRLGPLHHVVAPALTVQFNLRLGVCASELRPIDYIAKVNCPVLVASGDCDLHTTIGETQRLYDSAAEPKQLSVFKGAVHTDLLAFDPVQYTTEVVGFLDAHLRHTALDTNY
jgi:uncharacterized protein